MSKTPTQPPAPASPIEFITPEDVRLIELRIGNYKGIEALVIHPGVVTEFRGKNAVGKTTGVEALETALGGKKSVPEMPLRKGASKGYIVLELGAFTIERRFTKSDSYLEVTRKDGQPLGVPPQAFLDLLIKNRIVFDPMALFDMEPKAMARVFLQIAGTDVEKVEAWKAAKTEERRDINREVTRQKALLTSTPIPVNPPAEKIDPSQLIERAAQIKAQHTEAASLNRESARLAQDIDAARTRLREMETRHEEVQARLVEIGTLPSDEDIQRGIATAHERNEQFELAAKRNELDKSIREGEAKSQAITDKFEELDRKIKAELSALDLGVPGVSITPEGGVELNGVPISGASTAERIKIGVAVGLLASGQLKLMCIRRGESLDDDSRQVLFDTLNKHGAQALVEVVDSNVGEGLHIVNGDEIYSGDKHA